MNPFIAFCLFVAARVFVQYLKKAPDHQEIFGHLDFLLAALRALQRKIALTELFSIQLNLDIEGSGLDAKLRAATSLDTAINGSINGSDTYNAVQMQDEVFTTAQPTSEVASMPPIAGVRNVYTAFSPPTDDMFAPSSSKSGSGLGIASNAIDGNDGSDTRWVR